MGVVGAIVVVQAMVKAHTDDNDMGEPVAESSRNDKCCVGDAVELLDHVRMRTRNWPDVAGLFLDELSCKQTNRHEVITESFL